MRVFISYSYLHKAEFESFHKELTSYLSSELDMQVYSFVFDSPEQVDDRSLMKHALEEIDRSDFIVVELSYNSVGVGIEAGYAKAKGKPVIYLLKKGKEKVQTMNGIADYVVEYTAVSDVIQWFKQNNSNLS